MRVLLEVELQRDNFIKFNSGNTSTESLCHRLIFANVQVLDGVELSIRLCFQRCTKVILLRRVVVNCHPEVSSIVVPFHQDIMILSCHEVLLCEHHFLSLEAKVKHQSNVTRIRDHQGEELSRYVRVETEEESFRISCSKSNMNPLIQS